MSASTDSRQTITGKSLLLAALTITAVGLSACNEKAKNDPLAGGGGLSGKWVSSDNVFTAEFRDGGFSSVANDTGETLSTGSYIVLSVSEVQLQWFGNLSRQENSAKCQRPEVDVLNCADQSGRRFTLRKMAAAV